MDELYKALIWLAGVALALGLVITYYAAMTINAFPNNFLLSSSDGPVTAFFAILHTQITGILAGVSNLFSGGAIALGAALAWMERRRGWLIALVGVTALMLFWPTVLSTWYLLNPSLAQAPGFGVTPTGVYNILNFAVPLIPVALALIFALIRRKAAATEPSAAEADGTESDGTLEIVRSPL